MPTRIERLTSVLLVVCAVVTTGAALHHEWGGGALAAGPRGPSRNPHWDSMLGRGRAFGPPAAPVRIVEFMDLECPFCRAYHGAEKAALRDFPGRVRVEFVHFPLPGHRFAHDAGVAAECAGASGRFTQMIDAVFAKQDSIGLKPWASFARDAGVQDSASFQVCLRSASPSQAVDAGFAFSRSLGLRATPTVLINGWEFPTPPDEAELATAIRAVLRGDPPPVSRQSPPK